eukprot:294206_1
MASQEPYQIYKRPKDDIEVVSSDNRSGMNLKHLLISGYFRTDKINVSNSPEVIIQIIIEYMYHQYGLNNHIVIFTKYREPNTYTDLSDIKMVDISNKFKEYSFQFKNGSLKHDTTSAYYVQYDIHPNLKKHFNEKYVDSNINSFIIRCGGIECYRSSNFPSTTMILFDSKQVQSKNDTIVIDGYIHNEGNGSCMNAVLYDKYNNILVSVGGVYYEDDDGWFYDEKDCTIYDFNQHKTLSGYNDILPKCLQHPCVSILNIKKKEYLISGGYENRRGANKLCYKLDIESKKVTELCAMNTARYGHCATNLDGKYENQIIVAGGGKYNDDISKSAEIYDIEKNKWILMKERTNYGHRCGTIWSDKNNSDIVYIAGSISNRSSATSWDRTLGGFIEYKDLRDNGKWKIMMDKNNLFDVGQQYGDKNKIYSIIV